MAGALQYVVPVSGGTPQARKELYMWPQILLDGKHVVYTVFDSPTGHHRARVVKFGEPDKKRTFSRPNPE